MTVAANAFKDFLGGISRGFGLFVTTRQNTAVYSAQPFNTPCDQRAR
jgi:hypothetical protein